MSNEISIFQFNGLAIEVYADNNGTPFFVAAPVAIALGYRDATNMVRNLDSDEVSHEVISTPGGRQEAIVITESGMYHAIFLSRKDEARKFRRWVTEVVLPSIRKTGKYDHAEYLQRIDKAAERLGISEGWVKDVIKADEEAQVARARMDNAEALLEKALKVIAVAERNASKWARKEKADFLEALKYYNDYYKWTRQTRNMEPPLFPCHLYDEYFAD